jgi:four helix bundle protein
VPPKRGSKELVRYLDIALGSLAEVEIILRMAKDLEFLPSQDIDQLESLRKDAAKLIWGFYKTTQSGKGRPLQVPAT